MNDSVEECLYQLYQIIVNPLFLQNMKNYLTTEQVKNTIFFPQGCTLIKHCNAQHSDSSV